MIESPMPLSLGHESTQDKPWQVAKAPYFLDFLGVLCVFFIYAGSSVPAINEPHYWSKAAHFWNSEFGKGDLFLESGDAHWLFFATFGYLTQWLPMVWAVWTGRLVTWLLLAAGWTYLGRSIWSGSRGLPLISTAFTVVWLAGMHWGHWAGEWVIGGCESKGVAYGLVFFGLAWMIRKNWTVAWMALGMAAAFHVVAGIWVIASVLFASWILDRPTHRGSVPLSFWERFQHWVALHRIGWILCIAGVIVGVVPALSIDWGADPKIATDSAVMQAYRRLGHHLSPTRFSTERWRAFSGLLVVVGVAGAIAMRSRWISSLQEPKPPSTASSLPSEASFWASVRERFCGFDRGMKFLILCSLSAFGIAMIGFCVDLTLSRTAPEIAAKILRFYWFRWNDVALPMALAAVVVSLAYSQLQFLPRPQLGYALGCIGLFIPGLLLLGFRFNENYQERIPAGDKAHLVVKTDSDDEQVRQYGDWLRACEWIGNNTDTQGLWLTPRRQQSFKWRTGRPELACWKDAPQNAVALVAWGERLADAYRFEGERKILQPLSEDQLWKLHEKYGIRYVLLDMRVAGQQRPTLPLLYPTREEPNDCFHVFEFPATRPAAGESN
jgi:hypothetical protein